MPSRAEPESTSDCTATTDAADLTIARYHGVRRTTDGLAQGLSAEDCQVQSMPDASPVKWHLAHTSWFFEMFVLTPYMAGYESFHPAFNYLFNSYYNAIGDRVPRHRRGLISRPSLATVLEYRSAVDRAMTAFLGSADGLSADLLAVIELGLNHEQQHQELILTDIKHALAQNPLRPAYRDTKTSQTPAPPPPMEWRHFPGGVQWIGHGGGGFAFDNEGPRHRVYLEGFRLGSRPVTIGEYLAFLEDGGYSRPEFWLSDGWAAVKSNAWEAPLYWERTEGAWRVMTLAGPRGVDESEPVCHVSYYEADAYARWAGARLPTEAEWELAASEFEPVGNFLDDGHFHPRPARGAGLVQMFGDTWEWTRSPYIPYPGSRPAAGALGEYNAKFMCNQLVLRGGSCATPRSHIRASYRNFFPPEARWQFSGIRLANDT
jgi:ergothioneine biosynthesis protein EgtB